MRTDNIETGRSTGYSNWYYLVFLLPFTWPFLLVWLIWFLSIGIAILWFRKDNRERLKLEQTKTKDQANTTDNNWDTFKYFIPLAITFFLVVYIPTTNSYQGANILTYITSMLGYTYGSYETSDAIVKVSWATDTFFESIMYNFIFWIACLILGYLVHLSMKMKYHGLKSYRAFWVLKIEDTGINTHGKEISLGFENEYIHLNKRELKVIERKATDKHIAIIGATGSGKTETAKLFLKDQANQKHPTIFIDGKGDPGLASELRKFAEANNQKFYLFRIEKQSDSHIYNGLDGNPREITDKLISLFDLETTGNDFFNTKAKSYLASLIKLTHLEFGKISILNLLNNYDPKDLIVLAKKHKTEFLKIELKAIQSTKLNDIEGLKNKLLELYNNTKNTMGVKGFTLEQVIKENAFVLFSINSLDYQTLGRGIGKFIVQDIKQSAKTNHKLDKHTLIVLDEFNVFADNNVIDILNKTRAYGYKCMLLFQTLADLTNVSMDFEQQVIANTNTKIIMKLDDTKTKDWVIKEFGTIREWINTGDSLSASESVKDSAKVNMNLINSLSIGEAIVKTTIDGNPVRYETPFKVERVKLND